MPKQRYSDLSVHEYKHRPLSKRLALSDGIIRPLRTSYAGARHGRADGRPPAHSAPGAPTAVFTYHGRGP
ncbi:hypothetical protein EVAR_75943_1 [Eumeta japonica]|uniref:Uncharacterized protein n=1 Tax=Eumeta variegata TaxID=151549 RepID=A0A4C1UWS0_EUMVA|nr:hypothetical protein EVAR_75943_1 [Eumeta japonica]